MDYNYVNDKFRILVAEKRAKFTDFIINAIAKARRHAESEGEAHYLMTKAVLKSATPAKNKKKLAFNYNNDAYFNLHNRLRMLAQGYFPSIWLDLPKEDKVTIANDAAKMIDATHRHYLYIFVRQDICPEQQAVQAGHATFVAGANISKDIAGNATRLRKFDPASTHFVLIGVPDLNALYQARGIAQTNEIDTHAFYEEDLDGQMTAFTTGIVTQEKRHVFKSYGLLKFKKEGE